MKQFVFSFLVAGVVLFSSCGKYEEGPSISLKSKKARLANDWEVMEATSDGDDVTNLYDEFSLTLTKDGGASLMASYTLGFLSFNFNTEGTWEFENDKKNLFIDYENNSADRTYQILKLTSDELWLREKGDDLELKLESK